MVISVITDGYENASKEFNHETINKMVSRKKADGWEFQFLAAGIDGKPFANSIGVTNVVCVPDSAQGYASMGVAMSNTSMNYASSGGADAKKAENKTSATT